MMNLLPRVRGSGTEMGFSWTTCTPGLAPAMIACCQLLFFFHTATQSLGRKLVSNGRSDRHWACLMRHQPLLALPENNQPAKMRRWHCHPVTLRTTSTQQKKKIRSYQIKHNRHVSSKQGWRCVEFFPRSTQLLPADWLRLRKEEISSRMSRNGKHREERSARIHQPSIVVSVGT